MQLASFLTLCSLSGAQSGPVKAKFPAKLKAVTARLYYAGTGSFSENLIDNSNFALWNTIIGEGSAASPSTATMIQVEVIGDGSPNVYSSDSLTVTTQLGTAPAVKRTIKHLWFSDAGEHFEAFWINGTGCEPLKVTVQVNNQTPTTKKLDFQCGD